MTESTHLWRKSEADIRREVGAVRAGRDLTPDVWPDQAPVAVGLSFDVDGETIAIWNGRHSPSSLSRGEFGIRVGLPRVLNALSRYDVPATFFIPGMTSVLHPEVSPMIMNSGEHEVGLHGWIHESIVEITAAEERELTERSYRYWSEKLGSPPSGIRTPSWDFSSSTLDIICDLGLRYDSSLMADDRPYELVADDRTTGIVELPVEWKLDDYMYFQIDYERGYHPYITPEDVYEIWQAEFDMACQEGTAFILTMHPQVIGHRSRIVILERLIEYMRGQKAWFATLGEIARYVQAE